MRNKNWWNKNLVGTPQRLGGGTPSVSAKRSVEQKCGIKIGGTKIGGTKIWWGPMAEQKMVLALGHWVARGTPSTSAKRSAEQKCGIKIGGTKIGRTSDSFLFRTFCSAFLFRQF